MVRFIIKLVLETLKPYRYRGLTQRTILKAFFFFFYISIFYVMIMGLINVPRYYSNYNDLDTNTSHLNKFSIDINIETNQPVVRSKNPYIVIDTSENSSLSSGEDVLITKNAALSKIMFWTKKTEFGHYDILSNLKNLKRNTFLLILIFIPTILVIAYIITLVKYLLIISLFTLIAWILSIIRRARISLFEIFKSATYSITVYYLVNIFCSLIGIKYLGAIFYIIFFLAVLFLMKEDTSIIEPDLGK
jgi:hypothetical protein